MKLSYKPSSRREKAISKLLDNLRDKIILDIGCADGSLGKIFKKSNQVIGVDISKEDLKKAKKVLDQTFLVDLNSQKIPLKNQSVDIIICSEVIEHLLPGNKLLSEAKRILKKDGFLIITTPNILYWGHRLNFLKGQFEYTDQGPFDKTHVHFIPMEL
jgi:2-polyprenyl-3-methyl-5-hydroxy-6-metoxy-1,4-benzoquinol methylase